MAQKWQTIRWRDWRTVRKAYLAAGYAIPRLQTMIQRRYARKIGRGRYQVVIK